MQKLSKSVLEFIPAIWLVLFILFVLRSWLVTGHIPTFATPDPKSLGMDFHHGILWLILYLMPWFILGNLLSHFKPKLSPLRIVSALLLISLIIMAILGPQLAIWPTIWTIPFISALALLLKGSFKYASELIALNIWIFVDPTRLMDWFFD